MIEIIAGTVMIVGFLSIIYQNQKLRSDIEAHKKAYDVMREAYQQERNRKENC
jgi:ABC-type transporter lipoprotein component MlaA